MQGGAHRSYRLLDRTSAGLGVQGFLTAVLQNHARLTQVPIDQLSFGFEVLRKEDAMQLTAPPEVGVCVSGLHLEAARYTVIPTTVCNDCLHLGVLAAKC